MPQPEFWFGIAMEISGVALAIYGLCVALRSLG